jgi:hypothetical protein
MGRGIRPFADPMSRDISSQKRKILPESGCSGRISSVPKLKVPNQATIHTAKSFLTRNRPFEQDGQHGTLEFHERWAHLDPMGLSVTASFPLDIQSDEHGASHQDNYGYCYAD